MKENYDAMKRRHETEYKQALRSFIEKKICSFELRLLEMEHNDELVSAVKSDKNGSGFIRQMFESELRDAGYNGRNPDALDGVLSSLGLSRRNVGLESDEAPAEHLDEALCSGFRLALKSILR